MCNMRTIRLQLYFIQSTTSLPYHPVPTRHIPTKALSATQLHHPAYIHFISINMKLGILLVILVTVNTLAPFIGNCFDAAKTFESSVVRSLENRDAELIIDDLEKVFQSYPSLLEKCGAEEKADQVRSDIPPACSKILGKEAKILVKIMRLNAQDRQKNEKAILMYTAMFETLYKTQVQKKCPFLSEHHMSEVKNKGECAEGMYQLSLTFEKLDSDLMAGKFDSSLTDMGKVIQKVPETLDSCSQHSMAKWVRRSFPDECLDAIGGLVRELAKLEHNYTHMEWLKKHLKDFTKAMIKVKDACPALEH